VRTRKKISALGGFLVAAMEKRGWSRDQLAVECGISRRFIDKLVTGDRASVSLDTAHRIADGLDEPLDALPLDREQPATARARGARGSRRGSR
jgi:transcriptional regulator with XRE-family HTH domain